MSPHSRHSIQSASGSRATIRTRGCLQGFSISLVGGSRFAIGDWFGFIFGPKRALIGAGSRIAAYFKLVVTVVNGFLGQPFGCGGAIPKRMDESRAVRVAGFFYGIGKIPDDRASWMATRVTALAS